MKSLLKKLIETAGPPGYETEVRKRVRHEVETYADEVRVDGLGNLIARKAAASAGGRRILVIAHMDEPGLIAAHVTRNGLVRFMPLGDLQPAVCAGQRVRFLNGVQGILGYPPDAVKKLDRLDQLFVDVGASQAGGSPVRLGDVAVFAGEFQELGECVTGKALDNRVGVSVLIECLRRLNAQAATPHELLFAFTTQEQPGLRGAGAAAFGAQPDIILSIDVCDATDSGDSAVKLPVCLGQGPVIRVRDRMMLSHPAIIDWMTTTAQAAGIPYQKEFASTSAGGAYPAQASGEGAAAGVLSVACHYRGSPVEIIHWPDVEHLADLLVRMLIGPAPF